MSVCGHDRLSNQILFRGGEKFQRLYMHNSNYNLKFLLTVLAQLQKDEVTDSPLKTGQKVYCLHTHNKDVKNVCQGMPRPYVKESFDMRVCGNCIGNNLISWAESHGDLLIEIQLKKKKCHIRHISLSLCVCGRCEETNILLLPFFRFRSTDGFWSGESSIVGGKWATFFLNLYSWQFLAQHCFVF